MREQWSSRTAFIFAAASSAFGFINIWRFPALMHRFGGGAFLVPYILALLLVGLPMLIIEVALGQFYQTGSPGAFGKISKRFSGLGISSVLCSFVVSLYYSATLAWISRMFVYSVKGSDNRWRNVPIEKALNWFRNTITGLKTAGGDDRTQPTLIVPANLLGLAVVWAIIFLCVIFGLNQIARISYALVILPLIMIAIFLVRSATLDGSRDGILDYIGRWKVSIWVDEPTVWIQAVIQVFFSLSIAIGVMTAYGSYNKRNDPVVSNSIAIVGLNFLFSFLSGFAIFGMVGYISNIKNEPIDSVPNLEGPGLLFATYPFGLSKLAGHGHWERLFFWTIFFVGVGSVMAIVEAISTVLNDTALLRRFPKKAITLSVCLFSFVASLLFATDTGILWVETVDFYVKYALILIGFFQAFSVGWLYGIEEQISRIGWRSTVGYLIATFVPILLACGLWFGLDTNTFWKGLLAYFVSYVILIAVVVVVLYMDMRSSNKENLILREGIIELYVGNLFKLRHKLVGIVNQVPYVWYILLKHFVSPVLLIVLAGFYSSKVNIGLSVFAESPKKPTEFENFGKYGNYPVGYQIVGVVIFTIPMLFLIVGFVFPGIYKCFDTTEDRTDENNDVENDTSSHLD